MTLELAMPTAGEDENKELQDFQRRFDWTLPPTLVVFVLAMFGHRLALLDRGTQNWIELAVTLPVVLVLWAGWPFFVRGAQSIVQRSPNMWTLIGLGTGSAFIYSVVATVAPQVFPASCSPASVGDEPEFGVGDRQCVAASTFRPGTADVKARPPCRPRVPAPHDVPPRAPLRTPVLCRREG